MFCVDCGKEIKIFRDGACVKCYLKNHSFSKSPEITDIFVCSHCGSYKHKSTWVNYSFDEILRMTVKNSFYISNELMSVNISTKYGEEKERMECKVTISGLLDDAKIAEDHEILIRVRKTVCDVCSKRYGGYHEAVLQIRADKRKLAKEEINVIQSTVEDLVESIQDKGNRALFITDMGKEHGGIDFYLSDKGSALTITKKIQEKYGGLIKHSSKNIGMKDSRQVYRMTYLLRLPSFRKGDFISYEKSFFYISSISAKKVHVFELSSWVEKIFEVNALEKAKIVGGKELVKDMILVSQTEDEVQIMDPKTYKTYDVRKPEPISFDSKMIRIVKLDGEPYLLPGEIRGSENNTKDI